MKILLLVCYAVLVLAATAHGNVIDGPLVVSDSRVWRLNETTMALIDVTNTLNLDVDEGTISMVDEVSCEGDNVIIFEAVLRHRRGLHIVSGEESRRSLLINGRRAGVLEMGCRVGYLGLDFNSATDGFYIARLDGSEPQLIVSGGFYEQYPVVAGNRQFYVFRSNEDRTIVVEGETGKIQRPDYLIRRVVLGVHEETRRMLALNRDTRGRELILSEHESTPLALQRGDEVLGFSKNGDLVYVSLLALKRGTETRSFGVYDCMTKEIRVIKDDFSVALGAFKR